MSTTHRIEHDGFEGTVIGAYVTREGKRGVVLQQVGTKVVHVYSTKWLTSPTTTTGVNEARVEAAIQAYFGEDYPWHVGMSNDIADNVRRSMRAALEAALSTASTAGKG